MNAISLASNEAIFAAMHFVEGVIRSKYQSKMMKFAILADIFLT